MQPANVHHIHEAPPADAFAHARFAETLTPQAPASRQIGNTVARWRERDASAADKLLLADEIDDGRDERLTAFIIACAMFVWIAGGILIALLRGAH